MRIPLVFIDLDGVLVDFVGKAIEVVGSSVTYDTWPGGEYSTAKVLGMGENHFWDKVNTEDFWNSLEKYPHADELLEFAAQHGKVALLSSPSIGPSASCKVMYAKKWFPKIPLVLCKEKSLLARDVWTLLIDDYDLNIGDWENAGGAGIIFPQPWNMAHAYYKQNFAMTKNYLTAWGEHIKLLQKGGAHV